MVFLTLHSDSNDIAEGKPARLIVGGSSRTAHNRGNRARTRPPTVATRRTGAVAAIAVADEPEHFANVIHAWDDIPRYLRGLHDPTAGRASEDVIHEIMMDAEIHGPEVR